MRKIHFDDEDEKDKKDKKWYEKILFPDAETKMMIQANIMAIILLGILAVILESCEENPNYW